VFLEKGDNGPFIGSNARMLNGREYPPEWLEVHKNEINRYANSLGYRVDIKNSITGDNNFSNYPASNAYGLTRHHKKISTVKLFWL